MVDYPINGSADTTPKRAMVQRLTKNNWRQELLGHKDVRTTIYTHVLNRGGRRVRSPADGLGQEPP